MTENELIFQLRSGNQKAVERWYRSFAPRLLRFIRSKVSHSYDAEEICQDTFLSCLEGLPVFKGDCALFSWMCSVAYHEIADYFRKKYAKKVLQTVPCMDLFLPETMLDMHGVSQAVKQVLRKLSYAQRELLLLKYVDRCSVQSIAQKLNMSMKATESALFRAKQAFRMVYTTEEC